MEDAKKTVECSLIVVLALCWLNAPLLPAAEGGFNGLDLHLGNLFLLSNAKSRSICPENFSGEKGKAAMAGEEGSAWRAARDLGRGWKVSPYVRVKGNSTFTLANIDGPGAIQHIWMT